MYQSFEKLDVWKRSAALAVRVYEILNDCRDFGLKNQMTRSAVSVSSNIAEGAERDSIKEFVRFLHISKGSAAELRTQIYIAARIGVLTETQQQELTSELIIISKMLQGLIKQQRAKLPNT